MADCALCQRPIADTASACTGCGDRARRWLDTIATVAEAARDIAHGERLRIAAPIAGTNGTDRLPINPTARDRYDHAANQLTTLTQHVADTRGLPITARPPAVGPLCAAATRRLDCWHRTCAAIRETGDPVTVAAWWLAGHLDWLRHRPEGPEALDTIAEVGRTLQRLADRPPDLVVVGACECGTVLYAPQRSAVARCRDCGQHWDVERSRETLRRHLDGMLLTAAEIATMAVVSHPGARREKIRKLVTTWAQRNIITAHGRTTAGSPTYRFGEVMTRLAPSLEEQAS